MHKHTRASVPARVDFGLANAASPQQTRTIAAKKLRVNVRPCWGVDWSEKHWCKTARVAPPSLNTCCSVNPWHCSRASPSFSVLSINGTCSIVLCVMCWVVIDTTQNWEPRGKLMGNRFLPFVRKKNLMNTQNFSNEIDASGGLVGRLARWFKLLKNSSI